MTRRCNITGRGPMTGNNVSHAKNRTRRRFLPNLHETGIFSEILGKMVRMRVSAKGMRTIEHKGGLDAFLLDTPKSKLEPEMVKVRKQVEEVQATKKAAKA